MKNHNKLLKLISLALIMITLPDINFADAS